MNEKDIKHCGVCLASDQPSYHNNRVLCKNFGLLIISYFASKESRFCETLLLNDFEQQFPGLS